MKIYDILTKTQEELLTYIGNLPNVERVEGGLVYNPPSDIWMPMLCVHLDTINTHNNYNLSKDDINIKGSVLSLKKPTKALCLGGDDRAGVWIALRLIEAMNNNEIHKKYRIGFFIDEEIGCLGSYMFQCEKYPTNCYIGLDRRSRYGRNEIATYGYENKNLIKIFTKLGYKEEIGSVTDASTLSMNNSRNIACVNLSVGYGNEHTQDEVLYLEAMEYTLNVLLELPQLTDLYEIEETDYASYVNDDMELYCISLEEKIEIYEDFIRQMGFKPDEVFYEGGGYVF